MARRHLWALGATAALAPARAAAADGGASPWIAFGLAVMALLLGALMLLRERRFARAEARRARENRRARALQMALDTVSSGIVALDPDGGVELANAAARRMLGLSPRPSPGERWPETARFRAADPAADEVSPVWSMLTGRRVRGAEYLLSLCDGPEIRVRINAEPAPVGAPIGAVMTLEDVTEQHRARVLGDRAERLDALGKLTGGVAHDFNNLLSTIMGAVQLAQRRAPDDPRIARHLDAALRATRTGAALVERLLGFAKRGAARIESVPVAGLFEDAAPLARNAIDPRVRLSLEPPPPDLAVRCDRAQIVTAILNLVANARDAIASDRGAGEIRLYCAACPDAPDCLEIVVADDGPGMSEEVRARALDPFFTTKGPARGTGLGLSMVYGALRRCGGDLRIDSAPGRGAAVRMRLTALRLPQDARSAARPAAAPARGAGRVVLLAEDETDLRDTAEALLAELGYAVIPARDGAEALAALERGHVVDVLVTDVMMPGGVSGTDLARAARGLRPGLPVVLASGYAEPALEAAAGLDAPLVRKPYALEELGAAVAGAIERAAADGPARPTARRGAGAA